MTDEEDFIDDVIEGERDRSFPVLYLKDGAVIAEQFMPKVAISGDTDSCYIDLSSKFPKDSKKEDVVKFADELAARVNETFPSFMQSVFNSNAEQAKAISTARDVVSDKGYYIARKNYILHYVNKEGVDVADYKMMGIAVKRSDTPLILKEFLTEMLYMLMDRIPMEDIDKAIRIFKEKYHTASFLDVGRPMSIKGLQKYEKKYAETKGDMKGFPYHVRATMYYNMMCGPSDTKIVNGNKIRVVYIAHPDIKYIAVPADADILPEFLNTLQIDWETQWSKVLKKINLYLIPLELLYED